MPPKTDSRGQIQRRKDTSLAGLLQAQMPEIQRALPKHLDADRMARVALTALRQNQELNDCSAASFLGCIMTAAQLGLEPNTPLGHLYLIPRKGECTMILGYQGMMELARRSGQVRALYAHPVYEGDDFHYELGLDQTLRHVPNPTARRSDDALTHVYAVAVLGDSQWDRQFVVLTRAEIDAARSASASRKGPWGPHYVAMALKTAVRRLFKWLPKSIEMSTAVAVDEAVEIGKAQVTVMAPEVQDHLLTTGVATEADLSVVEQVAEVAQTSDDDLLDVIKRTSSWDDLAGLLSHKRTAARMDRIEAAWDVVDATCKRLGVSTDQAEELVQRTLKEE